MHLAIVDHHTLPAIKLMNSGIVGLTEQTTKAIELLIENFKSKYDDVTIGEYLHKRTLESVKKRYAKSGKFYYPKSLYVTVTVHNAKTNRMTLDLNKDNLHTLNIYVENVKSLNVNQFNHISEYLHSCMKRYKYLL